MPSSRPQHQETSKKSFGAKLRYVPGLAAVAVGVVLSYGLNAALPMVSTLTMAMLLGVAARNLGLLGSYVLFGINAATKNLLRAGVVLLGLKLSLAQIFELDSAVLVVIALTVAGTFAGTLWLGQLLRVRPGTTLLVATGFSICGASAAAAMSAASDSEEEDLATAVALVTIFGGLAIVLLPFLQTSLGLTDTAFGIWSGAAVHEVAQVVATAAAAGPAALAVATVVKLTRVVLLAPLIAGYTLYRRSASTAPDGDRPPLLPLFVVGFICMIFVRSTGFLPTPILDVAELLSTLLLAGALFGLGTSVHLASLVQTGRTAFALGLGSTALAAGISLTAMAVLV